MQSKEMKMKPTTGINTLKRGSWRLPKMIDLSPYKKIIIDTETTGLNVWAGDRTIGVVVGVYKSNGLVQSMYFPYGHSEGPMYDRQEVIDWLKAELRDKELIFHHVNFDGQMLYADGLDIRQHNNTVFDTQFGAALIDPYGSQSLDVLAQKYVGKYAAKIQNPFPPEDFAKVPSWALADYAQQDGISTGLLARKIRRLIKDKDLEQVFQLECEVAPAVLEMEFNGLRIDEEKLHRWIPEARRQYEIAMQELGPVNPNSANDLVREFDRRGIRYPYNYVCSQCDDEWKGFEPQECSRCGQVVKPKSPHFGKKFLIKMEHPFAKQVVRTKQLRNLLNSALIPWSRQIRGGILRFNLNQLIDRDHQRGVRGTISGRFSANLLEGGSQPQQVWSPENQIEQLGFNDFILRELFIPDPGKLYMRIDASQIEYRLFAHYSNSEKLIRAYREKPDIDFHQTVADDILQGKMGEGKVGRKKAKNINFGKLYGMGYAKFARDVGVSREEGRRMYDLYDKMFPEAKEVIARWSRHAGQRLPVITLLGRRFVFQKGEPTYVALNRLIQGSAADVMKSALRLVYREKLMDKMRLTVHDELTGDIHSEEQGIRCKQAMEQDLQHLIKVPVIWDLEIGKNWAMR